MSYPLDIDHKSDILSTSGVVASTLKDGYSEPRLFRRAERSETRFHPSGFEIASPKASPSKHPGFFFGPDSPYVMTAQ